jgi:integrase/recombinase XerD
VKVRRWAAMRNRNTPIDSIIDSYLLHGHDLAEATREFYTENLVPFAKWLRANDYDAVLGDIDPNVVNQYIAQRRMTSAYTARAAAASLKALATWLAKVGIHHDNGRSVLADVRTPKVPQDVRRPLTPAQVELVIATAKATRYPERDHALVVLALDAGLRLGELCALSLDDLNIRERFVTIRGETSKSKESHEAAIGFETAKALERYKQDFREENSDLPNGTARLFLGLGGLPMTVGGMGQIFRRIQRRSGVRSFMAHVCRHTWATNFRKYGSGDLLDLKQQGGWRDDKMLQRYSHQLPLSERRRGPSPMDALTRERKGGVRQSQRESGVLRVVKPEAHVG